MTLPALTPRAVAVALGILGWVAAWALWHWRPRDAGHEGPR
jgi:hypothetical protein